MDRTRIFWAIVLVAAAGTALWWFVIRQPPTDEQPIREVFEQVEETVEGGNVGGLVSLISPDYDDPMGMTKGTIRRMAYGFLRENDVDVSISRVNIQLLSPTTARATAHVEASVRARDRSYGQAAGSDVVFELEKLEGEWLIKSFYPEEGDWQSEMELYVD